jgi:D-alanine--poly(phosphoribitol) ligase subunit 2
MSAAGHAMSHQERVAALFPARLSVERPHPDADLFELGVLDSLAFVQLLVALEEEFDVRVSLDNVDVDMFRSVGKIAVFIESVGHGGRVAAAS